MSKIFTFYIKVIYLISVARNRSKINTTPGFGAMFTSIKHDISKLNDDMNTWEGKFRSSIQNILSIIGNFRVKNKYTSFSSMRNHLSHGSPLPSNETTLSETLAKLQETTSKIKYYLDKIFENGFFQEKNNKLYIIQDGNDGITIDVTLLMKVDETGSNIAIYSFSSQNVICFLTVNGEIYKENDDSNVRSFSNTFLEPHIKQCPIFDSFINEILDDISPITEDYSNPTYSFGDDEEAG